MSALLDNVEAHLVAQSLAGGATGWTIAKGRSVLTGQAVVLQQTGGSPPDQASDRRHENPTIQIMVQGAAHDAQGPEEKAVEILRGLDRATTVSGYVDVVAQQSGPIFIGENERQEPRYTVNLRLVQT